MSSPRSLHAPLDATASSSRVMTPASDGGGAHRSSSTSSSLPSTGRRPTNDTDEDEDEDEPTRPEPLSNMAFYSAYHQSFTSAAVHHEAGRPYGPKPKRGSSSSSAFQHPMYLYPDGIGTGWSTDDKNLFFAALCRHGKSQPDLIEEELDGRKSILDVVDYLDKLDFAAKLANAPGSMTGRIGKKRKRWTTDMAPAAREVSQRWIEFEDDLADGLIQREQRLEAEARNKRREDIVADIKSKGPARLSGKGPSSAKQRETLKSLADAEREWTRDDWSESLNINKLDNIGREIANPIFTTHAQYKKRSKMSPPPIKRPEKLARPMNDFLPTNATYEDIQELIQERSRLREETKEELVKQKQVFEREKKRMWTEMKKQVGRRRHRGGTRLELAKLGVLQRFNDDGLDLFNLKNLAKHMTGLPATAPGPGQDGDLSQELGYETLLELNENLRVYVSNLIRNTVALQPEIDSYHRTFGINADGTLDPTPPARQGRDGPFVIDTRTIRRAQRDLGGARWDYVDITEDEADDDGSRSRSRSVAITEPTPTPEPGSMPPPPLPKPKPKRKRASRAKSAVSSRASSMSDPRDYDYDYDYDYDEAPLDFAPIYLPLPVEPTWDHACTDPFRPKYDIHRPDNLARLIRSLPRPNVGRSVDRSVMSWDSLPPYRDLERADPDGWGDGTIYHRPAKVHMVQSDGEEGEGLEVPERNMREWKEEQKEDKMERRDRRRDQEWERRVWETVEGMDEHGQGWRDLGALMDLEDQDLDDEVLDSEDERGGGSDSDIDANNASSDDDPEPDSDDQEVIYLSDDAEDYDGPSLRITSYQQSRRQASYIDSDSGSDSDSQGRNKHRAIDVDAASHSSDWDKSDTEEPAERPRPETEREEDQRCTASRSESAPPPLPVPTASGERSETRSRSLEAEAEAEADEGGKESDEEDEEEEESEKGDEKHDTAAEEEEDEDEEEEDEGDTRVARSSSKSV